MSIQEDALRRKDVGKRFLADAKAKNANIKCHAYEYKTGKLISEEGEVVKPGQIYTVVQYTDKGGR